MSDEKAIAKLDKLTADDYQTAFMAIRKKMSDSDFQMLKAHFDSPNYIVTATELANKVGFANFKAANLRYGLLAQKLLDFFRINISKSIKLTVLVDFNHPYNEWKWMLRPRVVEALKKLGNGYW